MSVQTAVQSDGGLEPVAPCKGNGISAQGKVNEVNDTLGPPPHVPGLKTIAPCRGSTSRIGATPPRHTRTQIGMQLEHLLKNQPHAQNNGPAHGADKLFINYASFKRASSAATRVVKLFTDAVVAFSASFVSVSLFV